MSWRQLSRESGIGISSLRALTTAPSHDLVMLRDVERLAAALSVSVPELLETAPSSAGTVAIRSSVVPRIGAILQRIGRPVPFAALCLALGTDAAEMRAALEDLDGRLSECGLRVSEVSLDGAVRLLSVPAAEPTTGELRRTLQAVHARTDLDLALARLVHKLIADGGLDMRSLTSAGSNLKFAELVVAGVVAEPAKGQQATLSDDARFSLLLDDDLVRG